MRLFGLGLTAALLTSVAELRTVAAAPTSTADWAMADSIVKSIKLPRIPPRDFVITDFGAKPDDKSDALPAISAAIAKAASEQGGRIVIPKGTWRCNGPIRLVSNIELHVAEGATVVFSPVAQHYLPVVLTRWEGTEVYSYSPLIYAFEVHDVAITGKGTIDGNANSEFQAWAGDVMERPSRQALHEMGVDGTPTARRIFGEGTHLRPPLLQFFRAERVLLADYTLKNSPFWANHLVYADHVTMRSVRVDSMFTNNDGVDVDSCRHVLIEKCWFYTGDDSVAIKSGRDLDGRTIGRPSEHVVVRNNDMGGEDGIAIGSEISGGIRHVYFSDNVLHSGSAAIRFKSNLDRGGVVEHVRVRNTTVESFEHLFWFQLDYPGVLDGDSPSTYRDIVFENFTVGHAGTVFDAHAPATVPLRNVTLRNVTVKQADKTFVLENVEGLRLERVRISDQEIVGSLDWKTPSENQLGTKR